MVGLHCALPVLIALALLSILSPPTIALTLDGQVLPADFVYGCGTSAYQIEGAWKADGKGKSIWDTFANDKGKGHVANDEIGNVAMDFYNTYKRDLALFKSALNINTYDFTIAWTRLLPTGKGTKVNEKGLAFYRDMIRQVHANNMTASCTLYHWDLPQALQDEYKGWLSKKVVADFENYAKVAMEHLGGDCDRWISMNEPRTFVNEGYGTEVVSAPGLVGPLENQYKAMHNALLAHAASYRVFKGLKSSNKVKGTFGIKVDGGVALPLDPKSQADIAAAKRAPEFEIGWVVAPLTKGNYPKVMRDTMGNKLPSFTAKEQTQLRDSYDVIWYDTYTHTYAAAIKGKCEESNEDANWPTCVEDSQTRNGKPIGIPTGSEWNFQVEETIYSGLKYMHDRWGVKMLAVGETGLTLLNRSQHDLKWQLNDYPRISWYRNSLRDVKRAVKEGLPLIGFVPWSCISNLEWSNGYQGDFGLIYTTPGKDQPRRAKLSSIFLRDVMTKGEPIESAKYKEGGSAKVNP